MALNVVAMRARLVIAACVAVMFAGSPAIAQPAAPAAAAVDSMPSAEARALGVEVARRVYPGVLVDKSLDRGLDQAVASWRSLAGESDLNMDAFKQSLRVVIPDVRTFFYEYLGVVLAKNLSMTDLQSDLTFLKSPGGAVLTDAIEADASHRARRFFPAASIASANRFADSPRAQRLKAAMANADAGALVEMSQRMAPRMFRTIADRLEAREADREARLAATGRTPEEIKLGVHIIQAIIPPEQFDLMLTAYVNSNLNNVFGDNAAFARWNGIARDTYLEQMPLLRQAVIRIMGEYLADSLTVDELKANAAFVDGPAGRALVAGFVAGASHTPIRPLTAEEITAIRAMKASPAGEHLFTVLEQSSAVLNTRMGAFLGLMAPPLYRRMADKIDADTAANRSPT